MGGCGVAARTEFLSSALTRCSWRYGLGVGMDGGSRTDFVTLGEPGPCKIVMRGHKRHLLSHSISTAGGVFVLHEANWVSLVSHMVP